MFFFLGILPGQNDLPDTRMYCPVCHMERDFAMWEEYSRLVLFFIPTRKLGRHVYGRCRTCGKVIELEK